MKIEDSVRVNTFISYAKSVVEKRFDEFLIQQGITDYEIIQDTGMLIDLDDEDGNYNPFTLHYNPLRSSEVIQFKVFDTDHLRELIDLMEDSMDMAFIDDEDFECPIYLFAIANHEINTNPELAVVNTELSLIQNLISNDSPEWFHKPDREHALLEFKHFFLFEFDNYDEGFEVCKMMHNKIINPH